MWRSWSKSNLRIENSPLSTSSPTSSNFSSCSFKDIQNLCTDNTDSKTSRKSAAVFHRVRVATSVLRPWSTRSSQPNSPPKPEPETKPNADSTETAAEAETSCTTLATSEPSISLPGAEKRIVVYFTSLRVVRPTFEDCRTVRSILRGFRVSIDERDLSMDSGFLDELKGILGQNKLTLPRVFIGGRYIGGAEEIRQLHEIGELKKFVEGLPAADPGVCDVCGGYRFILCDDCSGSHKLYFEKGGFRSCAACNENGLIKCPSCSCAPI